MAEAGTNDCESQKNKISSLINKQLKKGDTWYLVDSKWFKQWKKYVGYDSWDTSFVGDKSSHPGPVDSSPLLKEGGEDLKENLIDELDYMLLPEEAWSLFLKWYGMNTGEKPIERKVIEQGMFVKHCKVEVYLMDLKLAHNSNLEKTVTKQFSRADSIGHIEKEMKKIFEIKDEKQVRLWNKYMSNTFEPLNKLENTIQDAGLYQGQVIVIEEQGDDGTWPRSGANNISSGTTVSQKVTKNQEERSSSYQNNAQNSYTKSNFYSSYDTSSRYDKSVKPGLCGLSNLGNTCFMNSALQCMSNVPELTAYFLAGKWEKELNVDNPLGMHGQIATSYAELVKIIWSGKYSYTVPRNFKVAVGRFAPQFSGYQQQDSQELMAFLLDGLHEDLNRITKKPYIEIKDHGGRPDEVVAKEAWDNYMKRNASVIVDTFHGLLKSTLVCPECKKVSVTFDPFCYLSLPLPMKKERQIEVFFVPINSEEKTKHYKLTVPKLGCVRDLCSALSKKIPNLNPSKLVVADVYNHKFHKIFAYDESLTHIMDRDDIFIYQIPVDSVDDPDTLMLPVYCREFKFSNPGSSYQHTTHYLFGTPLLVAVPRKKCTYKTLYNCVLNKMTRYVELPEQIDEWRPAAATLQDESSSDNQKDMEHNMDHSDCEEGEQSRKFSEPFTFSMVNSYGSTDVEALQDDGKVLKLTSRSYVAMDWHPEAKQQFYDEKKAEALDVDESLNSTLPKKSSINLSDCIDLFTSQEQLGEHDPWYCPKCKKHQQAFKKFDLWQLPDILVIHLKRFSYNRFWRDKIDTFVDYPVTELNMKPWVLNPKSKECTMYNLIAVSNHYGGMGGGHYTAYALNHEKNKWYYFDDSSVTEASKDSPVTKAGYVLVYRRRDLNGVARTDCNGHEQEENHMDIDRS